MDDEQSGSTDFLSVDSVGIPGCLKYVVLAYRLACTVFVIGMAA